jgi:hypothetical protein
MKRPSAPRKTAALPVVENEPRAFARGKLPGARVIACRTTVSELELKHAGADWIVDGCKSISLQRASSHGLVFELNHTMS